MNIDVKVANRIATVVGSPVLICGNTSDTVTFEFDSEWDDCKDKTARFQYIVDGKVKFTDKEFSGTQCNIPPLSNITSVTIGVFAEELITTTGAIVKCRKSILCGSGVSEEDWFELGKNSVPNPLEYATTIKEMFYQAVFPQNYEMTLNIPMVTNIAHCVSGAKGITKLIMKGNSEGKTLTANNGFASPTLIVIDLTDFVAKFGATQYLFHSCTALKEVKGMLDLSEAISVVQMFYSCLALEEIRFKAETIKLSIGFADCKKLSAESVQSIVNGLTTVENAQTLSLSATIKANLTEEQMTTILNKNWVVQ